VIDKVTKIGYVSQDTCHAILHDDLNMHHVCGQLISCSLTEEQHEEQSHINGAMINSVRIGSDPDILNRDIAGNETWCCFSLHFPQIMPCTGRHHH
jgi:hypothetical protein